jgi:hypothetical protein
LRLAVLLVDCAHRKLTHGFNTGVTSLCHFLETLYRFGRITKSFLAQRDVVERDAARREGTILIVCLLRLGNSSLISLFVGLYIDRVVVNGDCLG